MIICGLSLISGCFLGVDAQPWPPEDPSRFRVHPDFASVDDDDHQLVLPESPWTYENGSVNPNLEPSSAYRRASKRKIKDNFVSNVPPYHPDYVEPSATSQRQSPSYDNDSSSSRESVNDRYTGNVVREGSEGYEVKQVDREEILRRYILSRGEEVGRYRRYAPETSSEEDDDDENSDEAGADDLPLGAEA